MAMNAASMRDEVVAAIEAAMAADYLDIQDDHTLTGYDLHTYLLRYWGAAAAAIINHIQNNARCSGQDSNGDTHDNVQIV